MKQSKGTGSLTMPARPDPSLFCNQCGRHLSTGELQYNYQRCDSCIVSAVQLQTKMLVPWFGESQAGGDRAPQR